MRTNIATIAVLRSYLSPSVFTVRSGPVGRQDLAILSPEGPRDNTQWNPKYGCTGTVTTHFALIALVAWKY